MLEDHKPMLREVEASGDPISDVYDSFFRRGMIETKNKNRKKDRKVKRVKYHTKNNMTF
jgi:hypothetical protein